MAGPHAMDVGACSHLTLQAETERDAFSCLQLCVVSAEIFLCAAAQTDSFSILPDFMPRLSCDFYTKIVLLHLFGSLCNNAGGGNQSRVLIFQRDMAVCVHLRFWEWPIKLNWASKNEVWVKAESASDGWGMIGWAILFCCGKLNGTDWCVHFWINYEQGRLQNL